MALSPRKGKTGPPVQRIESCAGGAMDANVRFFGEPNTWK
jgi:hypothetical protein